MLKELGWIGIAVLFTTLSIVIAVLDFDLSYCDLLWWMEAYQEECA